MSDIGGNDASDDNSDMEELRNNSESPLPSDADPEPESASGSDVGSDAGSDDGESDEDNDGAHGMLDLEASESDEEDDGDGHDDDSDGFLDGTETVTFWSDYKFPQFAQLPPELRLRVWELFSPMASAASRVIQVTVRMGWTTYDDPAADPDAMLLKQYESVAALLLISHETHDFVLKALPDTLAVGRTRQSLVRFHSTKDVVEVTDLHDWRQWDDESDAPAGQILGFSENVQHLSLAKLSLDKDESISFYHDISLEDPNAKVLFSFLVTFPNLKAVYYKQPHRKVPSRLIHWCGQEDSAHTYELIHTEESESGFEVEIKTIFAWPKIEKYTSPHLREHLPGVRDLGDLADEYDVDDPPQYPLDINWLYPDPDPDLEAPLLMSELLAGIELWPMVRFKGAAAYGRFEKLETSKLEDLEEEDDDEDDDSMDSLDGVTWGDIGDMGGMDSDATDSEMDDFIEYDEFSEEALPAAAQNAARLDSDDTEDADEDDLSLGVGEGAPLFNGFSPAQESSQDDDVLSDSDDAEPSHRPSNKRKSRQVIDTDDDEQDEDEDDLRPAKIQRRSRRLVESDSEEEDEGDEGTVGNGARADKADSRSSAASDVSATQDESDSEDQGHGHGGGRNLTFAERLMAHRDANPVGSDADSDGADNSDEGTTRNASDDDDGEDDEDNGTDVGGPYAEDMDDNEGHSSDDVRDDGDMDVGEGYDDDDDDDDDGW